MQNTRAALGARASVLDQLSGGGLYRAPTRNAAQDHDTQVAAPPCAARTPQ